MAQIYLVRILDFNGIVKKQRAFKTSNAAKRWQEKMKTSKNLPLGYEVTRHTLTVAGS